MVGDMPEDDPRLAAVTAAGAPLTITGEGLLRWTARTGWQRLFAPH
jgi:hypothetical protein